MTQQPEQLTLLDTKGVTTVHGTVAYMAFVGSWVGGFLLMLAPFVSLVSGGWKLSIMFFIILVVLDKAASGKHYLFLQQWSQNAPHHLGHMTIRAEGKIEKDVPTVYCVHPHGVFCTGWMACYINKALRHVHFCFAPALFMNPLFRLLACSIAKGATADKKNFGRLLREKKSLALIPGGFEEATIFRYGYDRVWLKERAGFVKLALQTGHALRPVYTFGESETYINVQGFTKFRLWLNKQGLPGILPFGVWWCPLLPRQCKVHVVVGQPLQLPLIESPTSDDVSKWHNLYITSLTTLFEENKEQYGFGDRELEIWPLLSLKEKTS